MRLQSFRVRGFRSIKDTDWQNLSPDNITGIIGQNEAGKTAILEALYSFALGEILQEYRRSDGMMPEVSCSFQTNWDEIKGLFNGRSIPDGLPEFINNKGRINLKRSWSGLKESKLAFDEDGFSELFRQPEPITPIQEPPTAEQPVDATAPAVAAPEPAPAKLTEQEFVDAIFDKTPDFETFEDFASLLPDTIDLEDLQNKNTKAQGYKGAENLLTIAGLSPDFFKETDLRIMENQIGKLNTSITANFRDFWSQKIGKANKISIEFELKRHDETKAEKAGKPFLVFWIKDGEEKLYPKQRSKGVRWFTSFYLQLRANSLSEDKRNAIFLIDEPGGSLHARAQEDVLKVFEEIKDKVQVIYTTHSPYLVKLETIYRLLAVQRADAEDDKSETLVLDSHKLGAASSDTLSPIYTLMGVDFSSQQVIAKDNNILLEEISAFYYIFAFWKLAGSTKTAHFLPTTGVSNIPQLANLFLGWGIKFGVVMDDDSSGRSIYNALKRELFLDDEAEAKKHMLKIKGCSGIEDLFSKNDFKNLILEDGHAAFTKASDYMRGKPKAIFALKFMLKVNSNTITMTQFEQATQDNIRKLVGEIESLLV